MKNILNKISIHPVTYFFILSLCLTGMFQVLFTLLLIILLHELGHIIVALIYNYKITKITFFPFGGYTNIERDINNPIVEELILAIAGITMQLILTIVILILAAFGLIREQFLDLFMQYNTILLVFNIIPIVPLDGHIIVKSLLEIFFSYKKAFIISQILSFLMLIIFIIINIKYNINNYIIISFLIYKTYESITKFKYYQFKFYLERIIKGYNFKKTKIISGFKLEEMSKDKSHFFFINGKFVNERPLLAKKFDIKGIFW